MKLSLSEINKKQKKTRAPSMSCVVERVLYSGDGELSISDNMKSARWLQHYVQTYTPALPDKGNLLNEYEEVKRKKARNKTPLYR